MMVFQAYNIVHPFTEEVFARFERIPLHVAIERAYNWMIKHRINFVYFDYYRGLSHKLVFSIPLYRIDAEGSNL